MSRDKLIKLILKIQGNEGTEEETDADIDLLVNSVLDPEAVDYIFHHEWTADFIADKIISYTPMVL
ncbi:hypothetical protein [Pseudomonas yamanorum]|jgi:hypothetical protein|uniref:Colicin immunity protein / pyocin immunity protein n=1 Tax=Pseudomonas yamanorum TaxID=515393 RepID=A0A7Y8EJC5_9PSED|nr:hypothetical protein [Pseudomonas yamanorum]NWE15712.1 hypothetical protein [Pseudomonas yamanorum]